MFALFSMIDAASRDWTSLENITSCQLWGPYAHNHPHNLRFTSEPLQIALEASVAHMRKDTSRNRTSPNSDGGCHNLIYVVLWPRTLRITKPSIRSHRIELHTSPPKGVHHETVSLALVSPTEDNVTIQQLRCYLNA
ncbi:hypothetical protein ABKN59_002191 [Abortiporus biennis]